ncbi:MAG: four helix bundle protein [Bacteroidetes bacterium]|nr:four helix bundle protein [Bacteroidota bacterium]
MTWEEEHHILLAIDCVSDGNTVGEPAADYGRQKPYNIVERTRLLALEVIDFTQELIELRRWSLADQLFRSGTSIGANMSESQQAESSRDFLHKVRIAAKEAKETRYWYSLCRDSPHLPYRNGSYEEADEIVAILSTIIARLLANHPHLKKD